MFRTPNPSTDALVPVFRELSRAFRDRPSFTLEDAVGVAVSKQLMASKGHVGKKARDRSRNEDHSRDSMPMQFKMYAEVFRHLGWFRTAETRTTYCITQLGALAADAENINALLEECLLAVTFPNNAVSVQFANRGRPYRNVLRALGALDGFLARAELIIGPLRLNDDESQAEFDHMVRHFGSIRRSAGSSASRTKKLEAEFEQAAAAEGLKPPTIGNYSRLPIAFLRTCDWAKETRKEDVYQAVSCFELTAHGRSKLTGTLDHTPISCATHDSLPESQRRAVAFVGHYELLERAGFDVSTLHAEYRAHRAVVEKLPGVRAGKHILFSPFQVLSPTQLREALGDLAIDAGWKSVPTAPTPQPSIRRTGSTPPAVVVPPTASTSIAAFLKQTGRPAPAVKVSIIEKLRSELTRGESLDAAANAVFAAAAVHDKGDFYPAVADLLSACGLSCQISRHGQNADRADAWAEYAGSAIPVEIKSPRESAAVTVKGVRQALENKVIALSRRVEPKERQRLLEVNSLVVGYEPPAARAEVAELVDDVFKAYGIRIAVLDFLTLIRMAASVQLQSRQLDLPKFVAAKGILNG